MAGFLHHSSQSRRFEIVDVHRLYKVRRFKPDDLPAKVELCLDGAFDVLSLPEAMLFSITWRYAIDSPLPEKCPSAESMLKTSVKLWSLGA